MTDELSRLIELVDAKLIPLKPVTRKYPTGREVHIARFNGFTWNVGNPTDFKTEEKAWTEIERICKINTRYYNTKKLYE